MSPVGLRQGAARFILSRMANADSVLDREALAYAKALLKPPLERENLLGALGAALFAAVAALGFAVAMVMAPPVTTSKLALEPGPAQTEILLPEGEGGAQPAKP